MDEVKGDIFIHDDEKASLSSLLNDHHTALMDKIHALRAINTLTHNMLEDYLDLEKVKFFQKADSGLNDDERWEYKFRASLETVAPTGQFKFKHPKVHKMYGEETRMYHYREDIRRASKEMMLVYLIIVFEEFLTNILSALFRKRRDVFRFSNNLVSYKEVLEHTNIYELITTMSKEKAKAITESGIDNLNNYLKDKLKLSLSLDKRDDWPQFREFFYRRNIVVHNYGVPDTEYITQTNSKANKKDWLEINDHYITTAFSMFENYVNEITQSFHHKFVHHNGK
jgi:hypothetical protein